MSVDLERYRNWLRLVASLGFAAKYQSKIELSGVVNLALFKAHRAIGEGKRISECEVERWLKAIMFRTLYDQIDHWRTEARDIDRELSIDREFEESSARLGQILLLAEQSTPSGQAVRLEEERELADALAELPDSSRRALELHRLKGLSIAETALIMGRSENSVVGLLTRGLRKLREILDRGGRP